ncbi:hypothetical protein [Amaricoccus sp.]|uniref:hypothetical protein n=1 Tax=Amaricoccus sp. TaxID=1872485 RepID=UPI001B6914F8|nr:hypothetical protein [Amaricoccus sp.]MBP7001717.1 hypothetical protein [Amaricoccus sp.]
MSDMLERARAHFDRMRNQKIAVPEWADEDGAGGEVYFAPVTLRQRQKLAARAGDKNDARLMAFAVILFARKADGSPAFEDTPATLKVFENALDPKVIARVATAILGGDRGKGDEDGDEDGDDLGN